MNKLYFRSKALDSHRALPIFIGASLPELSESSSINRDVPEMPTGMEKEEECEKHCQLALVAQRTISNVCEYFSNQIIIPTPHFHVVQSFDIELQEFETQPSYLKYSLFEELSLDSPPEYDLDSDDESWIKCQVSFDISYEHFELIFASLQVNYNHGSLLFHTLLCKFRSKFSDSILNHIYEYWLQKDHNRPHSFENQRIATYILDTPYSAFRKRNDRIITRRYRKHDEQNYEKMYQFKKTFEQFANISADIYTREKLKYQLIYFLKSSFYMRNNLLDWNGDLFKAFSVNLKLDGLHSNTYFNCMPSSFNANRITDLKRTKQIKDEDFESHDTKSCRVLFNISDARYSKFTSNLYIESSIINSSSHKAYSINPVGRFSFVSNGISRYIPPQYSDISEHMLSNRLMKNGSNCKRFALDVNQSKSKKRIDYLPKNFRYSPYDKQQLKSAIFSYKYMYPKISSSTKHSLQSFFCLY